MKTTSAKTKPQSKTRAASQTNELFTPRATLCAIGVKLQAMKIFETIGEHLKIKQKTIRHTPLEKITDAFIALLSGAHGLCEINTRLRPDIALQRAFGRSSCAEQSTVQETLDACNKANVRQMRAALNAILKQHSRSFAHNYERKMLLLDVDLSGLPCSAKCEWATKGYFADQRNIYGRQLGRVTSADYHEVITDVVCPGNVNLHTALRPLVEETEAALELSAEKRHRTIWRIDAGGGSLHDVNWLLSRGYQIHLKDCSSSRAAAYAQTVLTWHRDPERPEREFGWATTEKLDNVRHVRRLIIRAPTKRGGIYHGALLSTLAPRQVFELLGTSSNGLSDPATVLQMYAKLYDLRGGAIEIEFKQDKQGFGLTKLNKKSYHAQEMVQLLGVLAHNVLLWAKDWLSESAPKLKQYGTVRFVRDVFTSAGRVTITVGGAVQEIVINGAVPLARQFIEGLRRMLKAEKVKVILGET